MPNLSRWAIRLALGYLLLGFTIGAIVLVHKGTGWWPWIWRWLPAHQEFLLLGWTTQMALGVAYWIFPRYRGNRRGNPMPAVLAVVGLNAGVWMVALAPWLGARWTVLGRGLEGVAVALFVAYAWSRVKPIGA